jgi:hypothetical protein
VTDQDITDPATGKSRLLTEQCATCIFRPRDPMYLQPGRLAQLIADALACDRYIICRDTLTYGPHPAYRPAICRGFHDAYRYRSLAIRLMYAFDNITEVPPPTNAAEPGIHTSEPTTHDYY